MASNTAPKAQHTAMHAPINLKFASRFWLKLGLISFGGPAGQIAIIHQELVRNRHWISEKRFLHALNYCMVLPGPEAQQLATYIGWLMHGTAGGIVAGALFVLPSLAILILLSWLYIAFGDIHWVAGIFYGIKPAVTAIVALAAIRLGTRILRNAALWAIAGLSFIGLSLLQLQFPLIIIGAALIGGIGGWLKPKLFLVHGNNKSAQKSYGPAFIDDNTPPTHAQFSLNRLLKFIFAGCICWLLPFSMLVILLGWPHTFTQMAWFFTKTALLTFGGAYAVLPYVYQGAINHYNWLTPTQMIDGLALGETTPGPLIMVVAFVAFVGGYTQSIFDGEYTFLAGAIAATLVTWFTFLPSFLFILIGGPIIESTHSKLKLAAPLTAITAAVVGGILNLAIFFAYHLIWPNGWSNQIDWLAGLMSISAGVAFFYFKSNVLHVIGACALIGLILKTAGA